MNYARRLWDSFRDMTLRESLTATGLGGFIGWVLAQIIGVAAHPVAAYLSAPSCIIGANLLIAWARLQPNMPIYDRPESKREP